MNLNVGIVIAMPEEAAPLLSLLDLDRPETHYAGAQFYHRDRLTLAVGGVGTLAAATTTQALIDKYRCNYIYNIGTAGCTGHAFRTGTVVSIQKVFKGDVDLTIFGNEPFQYPGMPVFLEPETDDRFPLATCRTTDRFIDKNSGVEAGYIVEMEGFPVAYVCARNNIPCRLYKVVSDMADENEDSSQFDGNLNSVSKLLAKHVYKTIESQLRGAGN